MCGIFGFVLERGAPANRDVFDAAVTTLFTLSEPRGKEASGLLVALGRHIEVLKRPLRPSQFLASRDFAQLSASTADLVSREGDTLTCPLVVIGHSRLVTHGAEALEDHNQPVIAGRLVGVHNGIITNTELLTRRHPSLRPTSDLDSEVLFRLIDDRARAWGNVQAAVSQAFGELEGTASIGCLRDCRQLVLATNIGSLYFAHDPETGRLVFTSERYSLERFLAHGHWPISGAVRQLTAGKGLWLDLPSHTSRLFELGEPAPTIHDRPPKTEAPVVIERRSAVGTQTLQRCTQCILPSTYPFITFDDQGRCNYCRDYQPPQLAGREALEVELSRHRRTDGQPDCIVAFSGGRDSSYGLHLLKRELGMTPVAFSYDWGMVTGIARRNQARLCGKLGVEHILRAADIRSKRRYMRKNILAWLKRPHLGMVPLFMAGDKFFYKVARDLRRELRIPLVVFCAGNPLERTDFKGGFAGVRESAHGQRLFAYSLQNKVQIALFYGLQYFHNPAYFNESFADSIGSFIQTFIARDDFLYLYHYLPWDEETINRTLRNEYDWEMAPHTDNSWRIGDGYTSFVNHIYFTLAGFSEFDVFRSQQVRSGILTRGQALSLAERENVPNLGVLQEFTAQVGLNLEEVLARIESAPRHY